VGLSIADGRSPPTTAATVLADTYNGRSPASLRLPVLGFDQDGRIPYRASPAACGCVAFNPQDEVA